MRAFSLFLRRKIFDHRIRENAVPEMRDVGKGTSAQPPIEVLREGSQKQRVGCERQAVYEL